MREKFHRTERDIFSSAFYRFCFPPLFYGRDTAGACFTFVQLLFTVSCYCFTESCHSLTCNDYYRSISFLGNVFLAAA